MSTQTMTSTPDAIPTSSGETSPNGELKRCDVLGVGISAVDLPMAVATIDKWIRRGEKHYVCITGVHGVMESQRDPALKRIHNRAGMVTPDGMPMVWMNWLRGNSWVRRGYGPDVMLAVCEAGVAKGHKHFFMGGKEGVAELLKEKLTAKFPGMQVVGTYCPPFRALTAEEDAALIKQINDSGADIVWVGLSTPKQEKWMDAHIGKLDASVMVGVGAAFDFHAGLVEQAPKFIQKSGFEWLYRVTKEPKRLWKRYAVNNPLFLWSLLLSFTHLKDFSEKPAASEAKAR